MTTSPGGEQPDGSGWHGRGGVKPGITRRALLSVAVVTAVIGAGVSWWHWKDEERARREAKEAVDLLYQQTLLDANGQVFRFEQLRGQQVVVNFWATWCAPCVEEMPELSALADELRPTGTRFVGVGVDNQAAIAAFAGKVPVSYPLVVANATGAFLAAQFGNAAGGLPYTVVIGPAGKVKTRILGRVSIASLREVLRSADVL